MNFKLKQKIIQRFGTQSDFAPVIGKGETYVSKIIRGRRALDPEAKKKWAQVLGCKVKDIFDDWSD